MIYPTIIKGVWQSYACAGEHNSDAEVPIEDIDKFLLSHETDKNGLQVQAVIKKDLVTRYASKYSDEKIVAKYPLFHGYVTIRGKDMPKFRREVYKELMKQPTQTNTVGINAGTPIAQSFTYGFKELKVEVN